MKKYFSIFVILLGLTPNAYAGSCSDSFLSIPTELNWQCIFPISIGGVIEMDGAQNIGDEDIGDSICACGGASPTVGISVSFWEPARVNRPTNTAHTNWAASVVFNWAH
jgi:conjugal transfer pilus assembly protein TraU